MLGSTRCRRQGISMQSSTQSSVIGSALCHRCSHRLSHLFRPLRGRSLPRRHEFGVELKERVGAVGVEDGEAFDELRVVP